MNIDPKQVTDDLVDFIRNEVHKAGLKRAVVGLSGGLDSAVVAILCCKALGHGDVLAVTMPYRTSNADSCGHWKLTRIQASTISITTQVDIYFAQGSTAWLGESVDAHRLRVANKCARERMSILYDQSAAFNALVIGTSNRSEILLGYGTIYGDTACAIAPLAKLYKTQVRQLAEYLEVPESIRTKPPSADLWPGQTDEGELGYSYEEMDPLLEALDQVGDLVFTPSMHHFPTKMMIDVTKRIKANAFKSQLPRTP